MTFLSLLITLVAIPLTWWRPGIGLALAANAYLITGALASQESGSIENNNLLNILLPIAVIFLTLCKSFDRLRYYRFHLLDGIILFLGLWLFASSFRTPAMDKGLEIGVRYFVLGSSFYFCARLIPLADSRRVKENISLVVFTYWLMAIVLSTIAFFNLITAGTTFSRLTVGTTNPIPFSLLIASGILANAYWIVASRQTPLIIKAVLYGSLGFLVLILMASNTRSMVIALLVALPVMVAQSLRGKSLSTAISVISISIVGLSLIVWGISVWQPELYNHWFARLSLITAENKGASVNDREDSYAAALKLFEQHPVFGVGTGNFSLATDNLISYAHNLSLELLSEQGIVGILIFAAMIGAALWLIFSAGKVGQTNPLIYLFGSWSVLCFVVSQFSFTLWQHKNLFLSLGMLVAAYYYHLHDEPRLKSRFARDVSV